MANRKRALSWGKEVERRARDYYRVAYPETERTKRHGVEDYEGCPDLVGLPYHVQVKARASSTISSMWLAAEKVRRRKETGLTTHLVSQSKSGPVLVTMKLLEYTHLVREVHRWRRYGMEKLGGIPTEIQLSPPEEND